MDRRVIRVSVLVGILAQRDAISTSCRQHIEALRNHARRHSLRLKLKVYTTFSQWNDSCVEVVSSPTQVIKDPHFLQSNVIWYEFGILSPLFDTIFLAPRPARVIVFYYGITPPHLSSPEQRPILERSYDQLKNVLLADLAVCTSRYLMDELLRVGVAPERLRKLGLTASVGARADVPARSPRPNPNVSNLLYVGRFVPAKGVLDLVKAVGAAHHATGVDLRLTLVGNPSFSDHRYLEQLRQVAAELKIEQRLYWKLDLSDHQLAHEYAEADAVVIPSYHEGFCVPIIEALEHRRLVIHSDAGAMPETAAGLGRTFRTGDVMQLRDRILEFHQAVLNGDYVTDTGAYRISAWNEQVARFLESFQRPHFDRNVVEIVLDGRTCAIADDMRQMLARTHQNLIERLLIEPRVEAEKPIERKVHVFLSNLGLDSTTSADSIRLTNQSDLQSGEKAMDGTCVSANRLRWIALKRRLKSIPLVGKPLVHVKRFLLMPRTVHQILKRFEQLNDHEIRNCVREIAVHSSTLIAETVGSILDQRFARTQVEIESLQTAIRRRYDGIEPLSQRIEGQGALLEDLQTAIRRQYDGIGLLSQRIEGQGALLEILGRKIRMMAMDIREHNAAQDDQALVPEPRIVDAESLARKTESSGGAVRLNLGCGEKPLAGYINVDAREMPDVDIVADIRKLPFLPGSVHEIMSAHLVEHFRQHQFQHHILPYWSSLLVDTGMLRIICPNWAAMIRRLNDGRMAYEDFRTVTFGSQDYLGDDHFAMYTPETLRRVLEEAGFEQIQVVVAERMNGLCPEMELTAVRRPGGTSYERRNGATKGVMAAPVEV